MSICVFFFGGYKASETNINSWLGSARGMRSDVQFTGYPYPAGATADGDNAVSTFRSAKTFGEAVKAIEASSAERIVLVGHSSGCAVANAVDNALKDKSKIQLIALDGYVPDGKQLERATTQVWSAKRENGTKNPWVAYHYDSLQKRFGAKLKVFDATNGTTKWALHFSLVDTNSDDSIKKAADGYRNCRANLAWL